MSHTPVINQPWEDVADDVTAAIEKAVQPLLKKAVDDIYSGLLDTTQDYLRDNLAFNIASRIDVAERQAAHDRAECQELRQANSALLEALETVLQWCKAWDVPFYMDDEWPEEQVKIDAAIALARGERQQ